MDNELISKLASKGLTYVKVEDLTDLQLVYDLFINDLIPDANVTYLSLIVINYIANYHENVTKDYEQMEKYYLMAIDNGNSSNVNILKDYYKQNLDLVIKSRISNISKINKLQTENSDLIDQVMYSPGGDRFLDAKEHFERLASGK